MNRAQAVHYATISVEAIKVAHGSEEMLQACIGETAKDYDIRIVAYVAEALIKGGPPPLAPRIDAEHRNASDPESGVYLMDDEKNLKNCTFHQGYRAIKELIPFDEGRRRYIALTDEGKTPYEAFLIVKQWWEDRENDELPQAADGTPSTITDAKARSMLETAPLEIRQVYGKAKRNGVPPNLALEQAMSVWKKKQDGD